MAPPITVPPAMGTSRAGDPLNVAALREITVESGGRGEVVRDGRDLDRATASIADELSKQCYLGYSSVGHRDGRWHTIRVELRDRSLRVRARRGVPRDVMNPAPRDAQNPCPSAPTSSSGYQLANLIDNACGIRITPEGHGTGKDCAV